jgi:hypothetical protein
MNLKSESLPEDPGNRSPVIKLDTEIGRRLPPGGESGREIADCDRVAEWYCCEIQLQDTGALSFFDETYGTRSAAG